MTMTPEQMANLELRMRDVFGQEGWDAMMAARGQWNLGVPAPALGEYVIGLDPAGVDSVAGTTITVSSGTGEIPPVGSQVTWASYPNTTGNFEIRMGDPPPPSSIIDIPLPEGLETIIDVYADLEDTDEKGQVYLEIDVKGPRIAKSMLTKIPESMLRQLDLEIKWALIRAFRMVPESSTRKRTLIVED